VLLHDRYAVGEVIRHSARGGVYRALDRKTGLDVVVKQARPHVAAGLTGRDARDGLRDEAAALVLLGGLSADLVEVFEQDDHVFLVETHVPGVTLSRWVRERLLAMDAPDLGPPVAEARSIASALAALLGEVHRRGLVYRDLSPGNIMVAHGVGSATDTAAAAVAPSGPALELRLIDPEFAAAADQWGGRAHTPGYGAPEYVAGPDYGPVPDQAADLFSLGATLFYLATGVNAAFAEDEPTPRPVAERLDAVLRAVGPRNAAAGLLAPAILGLCAQDPVDRWSLERFVTFLASAAPSGNAPTGYVPPVRLGRPDQDRLIHDGLAYVLAALADSTASTGWSGTSFGRSTDACNVQHGAAGILAVLTRADELLDRADLRPAVSALASFVDARLDDGTLLLPGLYFGRAGTAWALHDAAGRLGDDGLSGRARQLALALPLRWPNPDVFHGTAGAGLAQLHFLRTTGQPEYLDRVVDCADGLLAAAKYTDGGAFWRIPTDFDSTMAGIAHLGFAHGVAGIGTFLLGAAEATGRADYFDAAALAGRTLVGAAERGPWGARWRTDLAGRPGAGMLHHLCSGASGIGTFLLRLWTATGDRQSLALAEEAAAAAYRARWTGGTAVCHGLAGDGDFLLDMAQAVGGPYQGWAEELAACLHARHVLRDGRMVIPDESGTHVSLDYGIGLTGVISFLLRLRHGGPRLLLADS
jgi:hypothetical protein